MPQHGWPLRRLVALFAAACVTLFANVDAQASLSPGATIAQAGNTLSHTLSPSYYGIGIEPSNLFAFTGTTSPNQFTMTLLNNLASYTGQPPHIRIGGNSLDIAIYQENYNGYYFKDNPNPTGKTDVSIFGPNFFKVINYFPKNTPITYSIGMAYQGSDAVNMSVAIAQGVMDAFTNVKLNAFEVSNEPDLYVQNQFRSSGWDVNDYGSEWIERVQAVYNSVLAPKKIPKTFFEAACTATTAANRGFRIQDLVKTGVATGNGVWLAGWNQHNYYYYVGVSSYQLTLDHLLQLSTTEDQFHEWANQAGQANTTGKPYYLREMGSVGPSGLQGISNTFANALWTLNFLLYASTVGVQSVQLHILQDSYSSPWHPIADSGGGLFVRPTYYAYAAMSQIIGAGCQTQVASMNIDNAPSGYGNYLAAYTIYDAGNLQSIVVINAHTAYESQGSGISTQQFTANLPASMSGKVFYISELTAGGADSTSDATWNGMSYEKNGDGSSSKSGGAPQQVTVGSGGQLTFGVRDSSAVVANLDSQIGTQNNKVDAKACGTLADTQDPSSGGDNTFKATSGFASDLPLSLPAIIGIAAGGGAAILIVLAVCIFCCVRRRRNRRREQQYADKAALLSDGGSRYSSKRRGSKKAYDSVPLNDIGMHDSADDISMSTIEGKRRGHQYKDSYGSYSPSLTGSPLRPSTPRTRHDMADVAGLIATPSPTAAHRDARTAGGGGGGAGMYGNALHPQRSPLSGAQAAGVAGVGAGAGAMATKQRQQQLLRQHGETRGAPAGPRGLPPQQRSRVNSLPSRRDASLGAPRARQMASSAHGHGGGGYSPYGHYGVEPPPVPPMSSGGRVMQHMQQQQQQQQLGATDRPRRYRTPSYTGPPPTNPPQQLGAPFRRSYDEQPGARTRYYDPRS